MEGPRKLLLQPGMETGLGIESFIAMHKRSHPMPSQVRGGETGPPQGRSSRLVHLCQLIPDRWDFNLKGLASLWVVPTSDRL